MNAAVFTIVAKNYLPFARVLMASIRAAAPELRRFVILVDKPDGYLDPDLEDFAVILSEDLPIPQSRWFHFKYTILELATAVKPHAAQHLFEQFRIERLLYFDPDIFIYGSVEPLLRALDDAGVILTPHLTAALEDDRRPSDLDILRSGSYNMGFIGLRNCEESARMLDWWQKKVFDHCVVDLANGLFVDQRWMDLVPGMFDGVRILRDPGLNVAYWNIAHRPIRRTSDGYTVDSSPLVFFHFSGFDPENPQKFSRHQNRFALDDLGDAKELVLDYRERLFECGYAECRDWPYAFGAFENGFPIPDMGRPAHHESADLVTRISDPFSDDGYRAFVDVWNRPIARADGSPSGVTRLAYRIYRSRPDVQAAMPDIFKRDLLRFMNWVLSSGKVEHNLSDAFIAPIWDAVQHHSAASRVSAKPGTEDPTLNEKIVLTLARGGTWVNDGTPLQADAVNRLMGSEATRLRLTQLALAIYESRPDLQRAFPDPYGADAVHFLTWFLTYGAREYRLTDVLIAPMRQQWKRAVSSIENPVRRALCRAWCAVVGASLNARSWWGPLSRSPQLAWTSGSAAAPDARATNASGEDCAAEASPIRSGINFIGYVQSEMGVGESVRCAVKAARSCGMPVAVKSVDALGPYRLEDYSIGEFESHCPHGVNIFHVNADQCEIVLRRVGTQITKGRYNIGYWAWELEEFPDRWLKSFQYFDEIWTPSGFCQAAIARKSPIPVVRVPHAIDISRGERIERSGFSIPSDRFVFLAIFDLLSVFERKNPLGVLKAFRAAFEDQSKCHLVLKINHAGERPAEMGRIRAAADGLAVTIIDRTIDRNDVNALIEACDCVLSFHRSEGFGLTLAEAMYLGKPVIATGYSGNIDFTKPDNSFLVDYDLARVPPGCEPYDEGAFWAEPRLERAVSQLRTVVDAPELRRSRAAKGQDHIRTHFAPEAVGRLMAERLALGPCHFKRAPEASGSILEAQPR